MLLPGLGILPTNITMGSISETWMREIRFYSYYHSHTFSEPTVRTIGQCKDSRRMCDENMLGNNEEISNTHLKNIVLVKGTFNE